MAEQKQRKAQEWENHEDVRVRKAWQECWEYVRACRIASYWDEDEAYEQAWAFAEAVLGIEAEDTDEWNDLVEECYEEMAWYWA